VSKVFFDVGLSLDGFLAGPNARPANPLGDGGIAIHEWMFRTATFQQRLVKGGRTAAQEVVARAVTDAPAGDDALVQQGFARAGAYVMGRRMFDEGEVGWPEEAPFRAPVFVLTHKRRDPWVRKGGTTFHFVTDGFASALAQAKAAAKGKDVRVSGGADAIRQALELGIVDDFTLHVAPLLLGAGNRLFDRALPLRCAPAAASHSPLVTHLHYRMI
jgi:dihydrofolate reductase